VFIYLNEMGYGMTRRSASRGILYSTPPGSNSNESDNSAEVSAESDETAADTDIAAADD